MKKISHAVLGELADVRAGRAQPRHVADGHAVDVLHHHHVHAAVVPVHFGDIEQVRAGEIALQLRGVRGFAHQVQLVEHGLFVLGHHFERAQPAALAPVRFREPGQRVQHFEITLDDLAHAGAEHLHDDVLAALQPRRMHLRDRGRGQRLLLELRKHFGDGLAVGLFDDLPRDGAVERRHAILQLHQLVRDVVGQQVAPRRDRLAELDEDRTQLLEREPQPFASAGLAAALEPDAGREIEQEAQRPI